MARTYNGTLQRVAVIARPRRPGWCQQCQPPNYAPLPRAPRFPWRPGVPASRNVYRLAHIHQLSHLLYALLDPPCTGLARAIGLSLGRLIVSPLRRYYQADRFGDCSHLSSFTHSFTLLCAPHYLRPRPFFPFSPVGIALAVEEILGWKHEQGLGVHVGQQPAQPSSLCWPAAAVSSCLGSDGNRAPDCPSRA